MSLIDKQIQEWIEPKTKGFIHEDVKKSIEELKEKLSNKMVIVSSIDREDTFNIINEVFGKFK